MLLQWKILGWHCGWWHWPTTMSQVSFFYLFYKIFFVLFVHLRHCGWSMSQCHQPQCLLPYCNTFTVRKETIDIVLFQSITLPITIIIIINWCHFRNDIVLFQSITLPITIVVIINWCHFWNPNKPSSSFSSNPPLFLLQFSLILPSIQLPRGIFVFYMCVSALWTTIFILSWCHFRNPNKPSSSFSTHPTFHSTSQFTPSSIFTPLCKILTHSENEEIFTMNTGSNTFSSTWRVLGGYL